MAGFMLLTAKAQASALNRDLSIWVIPLVFIVMTARRAERVQVPRHVQV
jgi:hypothetical protein